MPWNDNANSGGKPDKKPGGKPSPWGAPPSGGGDDGGSPPPRRPGGTGGPGGRKPGGPGGPAPDLNDLGRQMSDRMREILGGGKGGMNPRILGLAGAAIVGLWALSGIYIVDSDQEAVVTTFGAYTGWNGPGLHYHAPFPIQRVQKVSVTSVRRTQLGGTGAGEQQLAESLMLTSDENIIDLDFTVQWKVSDASDYLFNVGDPEATVRAVAESAMREVVGKSLLQALITTERGRAQDQARVLMQQTLNRYRAGVTVDLVLIDNAGPPPSVVDAFRQVTAAEQQAESVQNVARGAAAKIEQEARAYSIQAQELAKGDAARFNQLYAQYKLAPAVTRDRLYIETMQTVLSKANKVVIDSKGASAPIILPPDVFRPRGQVPPAAGSDPRMGVAR